jgi:hypothetical protein
MHSLNHPALAKAVAAERVRSAGHVVRRPRPERPPSPRTRARVAFAVGRVARRLDQEMARRAVV